MAGCKNIRLRITIEKIRRELFQLGDAKPLTDPEVIKLSQKLDHLLNEYQLFLFNHSKGYTQAKDSEYNESCL